MKKKQVQPAKIALIGHTELSRREGIILVNAANIRAQPSTAAGKIGVLQKGMKITILSLEGNWYKVISPDSKQGYVYKNLVSIGSNNAGTQLGKPSVSAPNVEKVGQAGDQNELASSTSAEPTTFSIFIRSRPQGARLFVDKQKSGVTPLTLNLEPGPYGVKLEKAGYQPLWKIVRVEKDGKKDFLFQLETK